MVPRKKKKTARKPKAQAKAKRPARKTAARRKPEPFDPQQALLDAIEGVLEGNVIADVVYEEVRARVMTTLSEELTKNDSKLQAACRAFVAEYLGDLTFGKADAALADVIVSSQLELAVIAAVQSHFDTHLVPYVSAEVRKIFGTPPPTTVPAIRLAEAPTETDPPPTKRTKKGET